MPKEGVKMTLTQELEQILAEIEARPRVLPQKQQIGYEQMKPYWRDTMALQQMFEFCRSFPSWSEQASVAGWCETAFRYGRLPTADLRARLITVALAEGWKRGYKHQWDKDEGGER
jgi:hypothetical protein